MKFLNTADFKSTSPMNALSIGVTSLAVNDASVVKSLPAVLTVTDDPSLDGLASAEFILAYSQGANAWTFNIIRDWANFSRITEITGTNLVVSAGSTTVTLAGSFVQGHIIRFGATPDIYRITNKNSNTYTIEPPLLENKSAGTVTAIGTQNSSRERNWGAGTEIIATPLNLNFEELQWSLAEAGTSGLPANPTFGDVDADVVVATDGEFTNLEATNFAITTITFADDTTLTTAGGVNVPTGTPLHLAGYAAGGSLEAHEDLYFGVDGLHLDTTVIAEQLATPAMAILPFATAIPDGTFSLIATPATHVDFGTSVQIASGTYLDGELTAQTGQHFKATRFWFDGGTEVLQEVEGSALFIGTTGTYLGGTLDVVYGVSCETLTTGDIGTTTLSFANLAVAPTITADGQVYHDVATGPMVSMGDAWVPLLKQTTGITLTGATPNGVVYYGPDGDMYVSNSFKVYGTYVSSTGALKLGARTGTPDGPGFIEYSNGDFLGHVPGPNGSTIALSLTSLSADQKLPTSGKVDGSMLYWDGSEWAVPAFQRRLAADAVEQLAVRELRLLPLEANGTPMSIGVNAGRVRWHVVDSDPIGKFQWHNGANWVDFTASGSIPVPNVNGSILVSADGAWTELDSIIYDSGSLTIPAATIPVLGATTATISALTVGSLTIDGTFTATDFDLSDTVLEVAGVTLGGYELSATTNFEIKREGTTLFALTPAGNLTINGELSITENVTFDGSVIIGDDNVAGTPGQMRFNGDFQGCLEEGVWASFTRQMAAGTSYDDGGSSIYWDGEKWAPATGLTVLTVGGLRVPTMQLSAADPTEGNLVIGDTGLVTASTITVVPFAQQTLVTIQPTGTDNTGGDPTGCKFRINSVEYTVESLTTVLSAPLRYQVVLDTTPDTGTYLNVYVRKYTANYVPCFGNGSNWINLSPLASGNLPGVGSPGSILYVNDSNAWDVSTGGIFDGDGFVLPFLQLQEYVQPSVLGPLSGQVRYNQNDFEGFVQGIGWVSFTDHANRLPEPEGDALLTFGNLLVYKDGPTGDPAWFAEHHILSDEATQGFTVREDLIADTVYADQLISDSIVLGINDTTQAEPGKVSFLDSKFKGYDGTQWVVLQSQIVADSPAQGQLLYYNASTDFWNNIPDLTWNSGALTLGTGAIQYLDFGAGLRLRAELAYEEDLPQRSLEFHCKDATSGAYTGVPLITLTPSLLDIDCTAVQVQALSAGSLSVGPVTATTLAASSTLSVTGASTLHGVTATTVTASGTVTGDLLISDGYVRVGYANEVSETVPTGAIRYSIPANAAIGDFQGYDGEHWVSFTNYAGLGIDTSELLLPDDYGILFGKGDGTLFALGARDHGGGQIYNEFEYDFTAKKLTVNNLRVRSSFELYSCEVDSDLVVGNVTQSGWLLLDAQANHAGTPGYVYYKGGDFYGVKANGVAVSLTATNAQEGLPNPAVAGSTLYWDQTWQPTTGFYLLEVDTDVWRPASAGAMYFTDEEVTPIEEGYGAIRFNNDDYQGYIEGRGWVSFAKNALPVSVAGSLMVGAETGWGSSSTLTFTDEVLSAPAITVGTLTASTFDITTLSVTELSLGVGSLSVSANTAIPTNPNHVPAQRPQFTYNGYTYPVMLGTFNAGTTAPSGAYIVAGQSGQLYSTYTTITPNGGITMPSIATLLTYKLDLGGIELRQPSASTLTIKAGATTHSITESGFDLKGLLFDGTTLTVPGNIVCTGMETESETLNLAAITASRAFVADMITLGNVTYLQAETPFAGDMRYTGASLATIYATAGDRMRIVATANPVDMWLSVAGQRVSAGTVTVVADDTTTVALTQTSESGTTHTFSYTGDFDPPFTTDLEKLTFRVGGTGVEPDSLVSVGNGTISLVFADPDGLLHDGTVVQVGTDVGWLCLEVDTVASESGTIVIGGRGDWQGYDGARWFSFTDKDNTLLTDLVENALENIADLTLDSLEVEDLTVTGSLLIPSNSDTTGALGSFWRNSTDYYVGMGDSASKLAFADSDENFNSITLAALSAAPNSNTGMLYLHKPVPGNAGTLKYYDGTTWVSLVSGGSSEIGSDITCTSLTASSLVGVTNYLSIGAQASVLGRLSIAGTSPNKQLTMYDGTGHRQFVKSYNDGGRPRLTEAVLLPTTYDALGLCFTGGRVSYNGAALANLTDVADTTFTSITLGSDVLTAVDGRLLINAAPTVTDAMRLATVAEVTAAATVPDAITAHSVTLTARTVEGSTVPPSLLVDNGGVSAEDVHATHALQVGSGSALRELTQPIVSDLLDLLDVTGPVPVRANTTFRGMALTPAAKVLSVTPVGGLNVIQFDRPLPVGDGTVYRTGSLTDGVTYTRSFVLTAAYVGGSVPYRYHMNFCHGSGAYGTTLPASVIGQYVFKYEGLRYVEYTATEVNRAVVQDTISVGAAGLPPSIMLDSDEPVLVISNTNTVVALMHLSVGKLGYEAPTSDTGYYTPTELVADWALYDAAVTGLRIYCGVTPTCPVVNTYAANTMFTDRFGDLYVVDSAGYVKRVR